MDFSLVEGGVQEFEWGWAEVMTTLVGQVERGEIWEGILKVVSSLGPKWLHFAYVYSGICQLILF